MKDRCYNKRLKAYENYGARGIRVCHEWEISFMAFREWAMANGYCEGLEIDRKDNNGHYTPDNCQWISHAENCRNKRNNINLTAWGETKTLAEWVEDDRCNVCYGTLKTRYRMGGMEPEEMITTKAIEHKPLVRLSREQKEEIIRRVVVGTIGGDRRSPYGTSNRGNVKELAEEFGVVSGTIVEIWKRHNGTLRSI